MSRPIIAIWFRGDKAIATRHYARIDTAIPTMTLHVMHQAQPKDVVEFSHADTGLQLGTMKIKTGGKIHTDWIWEQ